MNPQVHCLTSTAINSWPILFSLSHPSLLPLQFFSKRPEKWRRGLKVLAECRRFQLEKCLKFLSVSLVNKLFENHQQRWITDYFKPFCYCSHLSFFPLLQALCLHLSPGWYLGYMHYVVVYKPGVSKYSKVLMWVVISPSLLRIRNVVVNTLSPRL